MKKIEANQDLPYSLMKNRLLHNKEYKELIYIVNKNIPNISSNEAIEVFKKLSQTGCSAAMMANTLVDQLYSNDEEFKRVFGYSLLTRDKVDSNKLMVDIFSKLYKVMKFKFVEYKSYKFNSIKEASLNLLKEYESDSKSILKLYNKGIMSDGLDSDGMLKFKSREPLIEEYVGSINEVARKKFGIDNINDIETLKKICLSSNIELTLKDIEIYQKLTGLGPNNFNFWANYYLNQYNIDFTLASEEIAINKFKDNYFSFIDYINDLSMKGYSISVSSTVNGISWMHQKNKLSWSKISSSTAGHVMLFKYFDQNNDIVVSSYGEEYVIPKEYFKELEFKKIVKISKERIDIQEKSR